MTLRIPWAWPCACAAAGILFSLKAGAGELVTEADYFSEQPVVLSASKLSQPVNRAPAAVTVITREMIEASGFRHLVDVLRLVPGFVVGWQGGNMPAATYIGLSDAFPHWMQIMVDGRSVYNPAYGHTTWRGIPLTLDEIDRIEVVRGPNSANDGLNSMLGTVHIYTRHSAMTQGGMVEIAAGDKQFQEADLRYGGGSENGSWRLSAVAREDERHDVPHDHATDLQLSFRGDFQPSPQDDVMLQFGLAKGLWQGTNVGYLTYDDQHTNYLSGYGNLQWKRALGEGQEWLVQAHHTFHQNEEAFQVPEGIDPLSGDYRTTGSSIQVSYLDKSAAEWRTSISAEYRLNRVRLPALLGSYDYYEDGIARLSGAVEWNPSPEWVLHAGAMLEHHSDSGDLYFSPRVAVNWLPTNGHSFRLGASQGASALSLYANNTDIKFTSGGVLIEQEHLSVNEMDAEKITSVELGYLFSRPEWGVNFDARVFHNRIYDIVDKKYVFPGDPEYSQSPDGNGWWTYLNRSEVKQLGIEYQLRWQPGPNSWLTLSQSWISTDSDSGIWYEQSVPEYSIAILASHRIADVDISLGYYRLEDLRWYEGKSDSKYNRLDLRLAKDWKTAEGRIAAALVLQSVNGAEEESFADYLYRHQEHDRRAFISFKYEFR
jgi:iron complex outermembrane receptor protein